MARATSATVWRSVSESCPLRNGDTRSTTMRMTLCSSCLSSGAQIGWRCPSSPSLDASGRATVILISAPSVPLATRHPRSVHRVFPHPWSAPLSEFQGRRVSHWYCSWNPRCVPAHTLSLHRELPRRVRPARHASAATSGDWDWPSHPVMAGEQSCARRRRER